jgi:hypothetical protein
VTVRWRSVLLGLLSLVALAVVAACVANDGDLPPVGEELMALEKARCEAGGGVWGRGGAASRGGFVCFRPTRDANQSCRRDSDCESFCLASTRICAPVKPLFGCHDVLTESGARATVCVD